MKDFRRVLFQPLALLPFGLSLLALALVLVHVGLYGTAREPDEGSAARLYQLLMALQVPTVAFFAGKWLNLALRPTLTVLGLQVVLALVALAPVFYWKL